MVFLGGVGAFVVCNEGRQRVFSVYTMVGFVVKVGILVSVRRQGGHLLQGVGSCSMLIVYTTG